MYQSTISDIDSKLTAVLDDVGIIGTTFRSSLLRDLKAKVVLRAAGDSVEVVGPQGSGRHQAARAAHAVATDLLGRTGPMVDFDCAEADADPRVFRTTLSEAVREAQGGTLLLDRYMALDNERRGIAGRTLRKAAGEVLGLALSEASTDSNVQGYRPATQIRIKPLHEREEDVWELVDHFFTSAAADCGLTACRGFSRQAHADIAGVVKDTSLESVTRLRDLVRDMVFEQASTEAPPLKLTSEHVRPVLERSFQQTEASRVGRDVALVASQFEAMAPQDLLTRLSELHGVPAELLSRQVEVLRDVIAHIDDVPRSYRNIMDRADDIQRASLWLLTGANTQAEFRRFFGTERFMQPTKSVAWAFYNRVFKRER